MIEIEYTSQFYTEQLKKFFQNNPDIDYKQLQSPQYDIDFNKKIVMRKFTKKYKFEANLPFEVRKSISLKSVSNYLYLFPLERIPAPDQSKELVSQQDLPGQGHIPLPQC